MHKYIINIYIIVLSNTMNRIQNKGFCLLMYVYCVYLLCIFIYNILILK